VNYPKVKHRRWIQHCNIDRVVRLCKQDKIPEVLEGFMLKAGCTHVLRCIYGSNLRAALALLGEALWDKATYPWRYFDWLLHRKQWEDEEVADEMREIEDEIRTAQ
jgi:hypothetical protein